MPTMKIFINPIALILILLPNLAYGTDAEWEALLKLKDNYYYLDKQQFNKISCVIDVPLMTNIIEEVKKQLAPLHEQVEIRANLSSFILAYSPKSGLSFSDPEFDIILKNKEGIADPEKVEKGIAMMKVGFKQQVDGVKDTLSGIFDDYNSPQKEKYQDLAVTKNKEGFIVKYTHENDNITENYFGNTIETSEKGLNTEINSTQKYLTTSSNKLILEKGSALINQTSWTMKMDISIEYQDVKNIIFPKKIIIVFEQVIQSISQKGTYEINLKNCEIN